MSCVQNSAMIKDELKIQGDLKDICKENIIIDSIETTTIVAEFRKENKWESGNRLHIGPFDKDYSVAYTTYIVFYAPAF